VADKGHGAVGQDCHPGEKPDELLDLGPDALIASVDIGRRGYGDHFRFDVASRLQHRLIKRRRLHFAAAGDGGEYCVLPGKRHQV
jgi:hypothetical protein